MASKFWGRGSDSEDDSEEVTSSSEEESSSEDDSSSSSSSGSSSSSSDSDSDGSQPKKGGASRFLMGSSDSESEDERRVVKSAKDKAQDELRAVCNEIRNKMHINDWAAIQTLFDKLNKQLDRTQKVTQSLGVPTVYIRLLVELEDFLAKTLAEKPKLSPTNTRALTRMKQTLRKHNAGYAEQMRSFRENPVSSASEAEESSSSESSESEGGESGEEGSEGERKFKTVRTGVVARPKDKILSMDPKEITYEMVQKKIKEVSLARGKTSSLDRLEHVEMLTYLASVAKGPVQRLEVLTHIVTVTFDMNQPMHSAMTTPNWNRCAATLFDILVLMAANPHITLVDVPPEEEEGGERTEEPPAAEPVFVWGNLAAFLERLDDEWASSLKGLDPHANEYMDRLRDETILLALAQKVSDYLTSTAQTEKLAAVSLKRMEHFYYKTAVVYGAMRKLAAAQVEEAAAAAAAPPPAEAELEGEDGEDAAAAAAVGLPPVRVVLPPDFALPESCVTLLDELARLVYTHGNDNQKGQAMLCGVYFRCIHDDFYAARDMLLMSRIQEQTQQLENKLQVLFNRTQAQLGLCAFRAGLINEAHQCLDVLYGTGRVKELLAQGIQQHRFQEKTAEQEAAERRRQVPFHMHINLELLETVYLTAAMLLEVPNIAAVGPLESRKRVISKPLRRLMENYERQTFVGPPESVRDHMMAACRALATGDWRRCYGFVTALSCWGLMPQREAVLDMLRAQVQAEGLRTYLLAYSKYYSSLSMAQLCDMFELPERKVHAIVSRLMAEELLPGSHDQPTGTIVMQSVEPSRVQALAAQFADKAALLVDLNERALALRTGVLSQEEEEGEGRRGPQDGMQGGRRTRMGGRGPFAPGASGRGGRGGRGGGGGGRGMRFGTDRMGLGGEAGYGGGVFGRGRSRQQQRDDSSFQQLGRYSRGGDSRQ